eukprot:662704-Pleurochrysis_carterae.AAC.1
MRSSWCLEVPAKKALAIWTGIRLGYVFKLRRCVINPPPASSGVSESSLHADSKKTQQKCRCSSSKFSRYNVRSRAEASVLAPSGPLPTRAHTSSGDVFQSVRVSLWQLAALQRVWCSLSAAPERRNEIRSWVLQLNNDHAILLNFI